NDKNMAESIATRHENWERVVWGLLYVKEGLQGFVDVRDIRNKTLHDAHYELDGQTADDCLDKMITVLEDPNELIHDTFAKQAANHIRKIKAKTETTPAVMTNIDGDKSLKVIEGLMYDMILERSNVDDLRQRLAKYYQKHLNSAPISPFLSDKDERLEKFYVPPKIVQKDHRKFEKDEGTPMTTYRHLFCKMGEFRKNVFMVGEAGMGKSSCAAMCAIKWANQFSSTKSIIEPYKNASEQTSFEAWELCLFNSDLKDIFLSETKHEDQFQDESFFKEIEFLFHLALRDNCDNCDLTDMVRDQLISRIYQKDERVAAYSTLNSVLFNKNCVIIADGLDEWTHPNVTNCSCSDEHKVIPYLPPTIDATVLITSRPWRMSQQRVKDTKIDSFLEIEGTADIRLLIQKVLDCLNETVTENKSLLDFVKFVDRMELTRLLSVPIISMLLVCLWFEGMHDSFSLCDIYAYTIEMMFGRKDLPKIIPQYSSIHFPRCFQRTEYIQKYYNILMEMAQLAFTTLFSNDKTSSLVFKKVNCLVGDHLLFVLKTGILQETKSASLIRKSSSYSFIHKTVQEFLAAIYMSYHPKEFH
ncbi:hypothetical protein MAR_003007, partial [Mya arenaria]